jgi:predicted lipoprotein with Yx(FWY)xxD motif
LRNPKRLFARVVGAGLLAATGAIHLDLYLTGYRTVPTIGWLFLLQVITAFAFAAIVLATKSRLLAAAGAGFALSTLGGYLLSLWIGLFGFREVRTEVGVVAGIIEIVAFAALASVALSADEHRPVMSAPDEDRLLDRVRMGIPKAGWAVAVFSAVAAVLLGAALSAAVPTSTHTSGAVFKLTSIHGVQVITNAKGFTLYWFVPDSKTKSTCYGTCAAYWPPVTGAPTASPGVTGALGTITRSGGELQATYDGHPLYTYVGDSAPGQATGNAVNLNGGLWYEMDASG